MRRKQGTLIPFEVEILKAAVDLKSSDEEWFHGFALARFIAADRQAKRLTAHGTLYKALRRLEEAGHLSSKWEPAGTALAEGRPRRRLYRITQAGARALRAAVEQPGVAATGDLARA
jgi:DNA-binding PadR family transcriptional regulator